MNVTLVHNPAAGAADRRKIDEILGLIRSAGHRVIGESSLGDPWEKILDQPSDLIAVAGGDGTVGQVAKRLVGRSLPLAVLPIGVANNVARTLGLTDSHLADLIEGWGRGRRKPFDVGRVRTPWGQSGSFIEAIGVGLFAETMFQIEARRTGERSSGREAIEDELQILRERLGRFPPTRMKVIADGRDLSGEYLIAELMNIRYVGPNLDLAPDTDPEDGWFDLVLLSRRHDRELADCLSDWIAGRASSPGVEVHRVQRVEMEWTGFPVHVDDEIWPDDPSSIQLDVKTVAIEVNPAAVEFLVGD